MAKKQTGWDKWREKKAKQAVKKTHKGYIIIAVLFLAVGVFGGYFATKFITKNDCFELNGKKDFSYKVGEIISYKDEGIKYISLGKDKSGSVQIETNMTKGNDGTFTADTSKPGEYYIIYKAVGGRCNGLTLYRAFRITENTEGAVA